MGGGGALGVEKTVSHRWCHAADWVVECFPRHHAPSDPSPLERLNQWRVAFVTLPAVTDKQDSFLRQTLILNQAKMSQFL